jgi:hypothetical protein
LHWGQAALSYRSRRKNVPQIFVFKPNIVIFEPRIIAIPRPLPSEMKYIPVRQNVSTLRFCTRPFLDPFGKFLALAMRAFLSLFFYDQNCRHPPTFSSFSRSFVSNHNRLTWPDSFFAAPPSVENVNLSGTCPISAPELFLRYLRASRFTCPRDL